MQVVILAGGLGTRLQEETTSRPKPMVEVGEHPLLWHIMKLYGHYGFCDFIVCGGYKCHIIKEYFANFALRNSHVTFDLAKGQVHVHRNDADPWKVTVVDTGENTMTGGRLKRVEPYIVGETFCMTYGDGLSNVDVRALVDFHAGHGRAATVTAVQPPGRFGALEVEDTRVRSFLEKPAGDGGWINGGFFVLQRSVLERLSGDATVWEEQPLAGLARDDELRAYFHRGFWRPVDTLRDKRVLDELWASRAAPWAVWDETHARGARGAKNTWRPLP
jgi:glucose-1-phosphate cytidylyltransferase